jgi:hypothetical protein
MTVVQYTFTHKQYTEQHSDTEYTEYHIPNNKNIKNTNLCSVNDRTVARYTEGTCERGIRYCGVICEYVSYWLLKD